MELCLVKRWDNFTSTFVYMEKLCPLLRNVYKNTYTHTHTIRQMFAFTEFKVSGLDQQKLQ